MGLKSSRTILDYNAAINRLEENGRIRDLERWAQTFKGIVPKTQDNNKPKDVITKNIFSKVIFGDNVPEFFTTRLFDVFSGQNEELNFRDLVCGLVIFVMGTQEEKMKLAYAAYEMGAGAITKDDMTKFLVGTASDSEERAQRQLIINELFTNTKKEDKLSFDEFQSWVEQNKESNLPFIDWIVTDEVNMVEGEVSEEEPEEDLPDIFSLEDNFDDDQHKYLLEHYNELLKKRPYWMRTKYELDKGTMIRVFYPPLIDDFTSRLFESLIDDGSQHMKLNHYIQGLSLMATGSTDDIYNLFVKMFDFNKDSKIDKEDLISTVKLLRKIEIYTKPTPIEIKETPKKKKKKRKKKKKKKK